MLVCTLTIGSCPLLFCCINDSTHWVENRVIFSDYGSGERHVFRYCSFILSFFCTNHEWVGPPLGVGSHERNPRYKGSCKYLTFLPWITRLSV